MTSCIIKNVTASIEKGVTAFPDVVTARCSQYLRELELMVQQGKCSLMQKILLQAEKKGVEVLAYRVHFSGSNIPNWDLSKPKTDDDCN